MPRKLGSKHRLRITCGRFENLEAALAFEPPHRPRRPRPHLIVGDSSEYSMAANLENHLRFASCTHYPPAPRLLSHRI